MKVSDYFAELYVAGRFAEAGWNVYFPHRDEGFDFIVSIGAAGSQILRPVQVKGKFPTLAKLDKVTYGYMGELSQTHPEMVLAIPYFSANDRNMPVCTAYMPFGRLRPNSRGYRCHPASFRNGTPAPRREYKQYFDSAGLLAMQDPAWSRQTSLGE